MPFQSEKQRRYLWANEPEIARDWADTYGSRIEKNDGGIMRTGFFEGMRAQEQKERAAAGSKQPGHGGSSLTPAYHAPQHHHTGGDHSNIEAVKLNKQKQLKDELNRERLEREPDVKQLSFKNKFVNKGKTLASNFRKRSILKNLFHVAKGRPIQPAIMAMLQGKITEEEFEDQFGVSIEGLIGLSPMEQTNIFGKEMSQFDKDRLSEMAGVYGQDYVSQDDWTKGFYGPKGPPVLGGGGDGGGYMGYPSYEAWLAAQNRGTGVTKVAEVEEILSPFQQSLTGTADTPGYYVGTDPTQANLEWGQAYGVDPRTMGRTSWTAANGGRIGRAFGGIMDTATGRRGYFLGSIKDALGSIGEAAKKVFKSPIGKAALMYGAYQYAPPFLSKGMPGGAVDRGNWGALKWFGDKRNVNLMKAIGIPALLPYLPGMGPDEEDEDEVFDYDARKDAYRDKIMNIKRGVHEGTLNPHDWNFLPTDYVYRGAKGGRAGYYAGGQSVPSDYTIEDAMMTTTQDKLGGITEAMKRADLYRKGSVGQMYAADGGRIGADEGGLMDLGGMEKDYRNDGGFVPIGGEEKADDVPARLSRNEFVFTADAVRGAGGGDIDKGAEIMENVMENLEQGGQISEESQGLAGAQEMFGVSERLSEVV